MTVDAGAEEALLHRGKSLLPSGVVRIEGVFEVGDVVSIRGAGGSELARGIVNYGAADALKIMGRRTSDITAILGARDYEELVHRNNMAILL